VVNTLTRKLNPPGASPLENPKFLENLIRALRREDVKCRFSNDRLAFLLVETDKELASRVLDRIRERFDSIRQGESADLQVGVGVAAFPLDGVSVTALLQCAEASALAAKATPRVIRAPAPVPTQVAATSAQALVAPEAPSRARWESAPFADKEALVSRSTAGTGKRWFGK
jgi:GGDEF domain-containing protein